MRSEVSGEDTPGAVLTGRDGADKGKLGTVCSGICAGIATGLASIGGLIVATYVLASQNSARRMRASLVVYILLNSLTTFEAQFPFCVAMLLPLRYFEASDVRRKI